MLKALRSSATLIAVLAGLAGVLLVLYAWRLPPFYDRVPVTDNAYVRGYVTLISPQLSGYVIEVPVRDYQTVKAGDLLVQLDRRIFEQKLKQAQATLAAQRAALANSTQQELSARASIASSEAQLQSAEAAMKRAKAEWDRIEPLLDKGVVTESAADQARADLAQARAAVNQAKAVLEVSRQQLATIIVGRSSLEAAVAGAEAAAQLADIDLQNTRIVAPREGRLGEVGARVGQYVSAGTQLMAIVPRDVWVIANFKETQIHGLEVGQGVSFTVDALQGRRLHGRIEHFSPAAGSEFAVLKPDNATGNFTKIAQRISVRISVDPDQDGADQLIPGMSVVVTADGAPPQSEARL
ncbi:MAG TPA: HlyD family secretion protein [Rhizobiaceae bacterium]|nr:HlyD family secretion protein [Rhizobiaceae bacterium]